MGERLADEHGLRRVRAARVAQPAEQRIIDVISAQLHE